MGEDYLRQYKKLKSDMAYTDLAKAMKKLAKDKMLRALSDSRYAKGSYEKEMEQDALAEEITK